VVSCCSHRNPSQLIVSVPFIARFCDSHYSVDEYSSIPGYYAVSTGKYVLESSEELLWTAWPWWWRHYNVSKQFCHSTRLDISKDCDIQIFSVRLTDINLLKTKCNLLYIRHQSVPHCKHLPPRVYKPVSCTRPF